jgi:rhamnulokinase
VDFALLDRRGNLVSNPNHYRDARTQNVPERLFARVPQARVFEVAGTQTMPLNTLFQLYSMVESNDPRLDAASFLLMMPDLFHYWLSGEMANEYTIASTTQMLDCHRREWAHELLSELHLPAHLLGKVVPAGTALGDTTTDLLRRTGLKQAFPVVAGASHDTASAVAAIPNLSADSAYISSGTWSLMGMEVAEPIATERARELNFTNEGGVGGAIRLLKNISGLWLLQECVRCWQRDGRTYTWSEVIELAKAAPPLKSIIDPNSEEFLAPDDMPAAIRAYCKRNGQVPPADDGAMARCCFESLSLKYRSVLESLELLTGRTVHTIHIVGGGSQNALLCQFAADACGRLVIAGPVEASALGNVLVQAVATGHLSGFAEARERVAASCELATYEPASNHLWDEAYARFLTLDTVGQHVKSSAV